MNSASATAHPVDDLAHRAARDARTPLAADHAAGRTIAVVTLVAHVRRVVRRAREVISLTDPIVEVARAPTLRAKTI